MTEDIEYEVFYNGGRSMGLVHGMQIGRFAVRDVYPICKEGSPQSTYVVDHIPTGLKLTFAPVSFEDAVRFADEVSRFSENDPEGTDIGELMHQFGRHMVHWISEQRAKMYEGEPWQDYRSFYRDFAGFPSDLDSN